MSEAIETLDSWDRWNEPDDADVDAAVDTPVDEIDEPPPSVPPAPDADAVPGLRLLASTDLPAMAALATRIWTIDELWDDTTRAQPTLWFLTQYANPTNVVFDVLDGAGVIAFLKTSPGWRSTIYAAAWEPRAMRRPDLLRAACAAAMLARDLLAIDSFILPENTLSRHATEAGGFIYRGLSRNASVYAGVPRSMCWYEADRLTFGLPEIEE